MKEGTTLITTDPKNINKTIKKYYEQFYVHKFHNLGEMYKFLERYNLQKIHTRRNRKSE